jgi:hypothetical protein
VTDVLAGDPHPAHPTVNGSPFPPKLLSYASPLSLYAEEIDAHSGRQLGNFPQAFSHLALINAVMHLIREDERRSAGGVNTAGLDLHAEAIAGPDGEGRIRQ